MFLIRKVSIKRVPIPVESLQLLGEVDRPEEAALRPGVAGGAVLHHLHHQGVLVTVRGDGHHMLDVAGGLPFAPELLAAAGEEAGPALVNGDGQALCVHVGQGQDLLGVVVLDDGGDQAVCVKFQIHGAVSFSWVCRPWAAGTPLPVRDRAFCQIRISTPCARR